MKANHVGFVTGAVLILALMTPAHVTLPECSTNDGVDFQIVTDKLVYAPKSMMHVKFLVANNDYASGKSLYLYRLLSYCSSQMGQYKLTLVDRNNDSVPVRTCFIDQRLTDEVNAVELLTNSTTGIALKAGEVFGAEAGFQLPSQKGTYRLKAELLPATFTPKQQQALADKQMRVLQPGCMTSAPLVTIAIK